MGFARFLVTRLGVERSRTTNSVNIKNYFLNKGATVTTNNKFNATVTTNSNWQEQTSTERDVTTRNLPAETKTDVLPESRGGQALGLSPRRTEDQQESKILHIQTMEVTTKRIFEQKQMIISL